MCGVFEASYTLILAWEQRNEAGLGLYLVGAGWAGTSEGWILNCYAINENGMMRHTRLKGQEYRECIVEFGGCIMFKVVAPQRTLLTRRASTIRPVKKSSSDEHIVADFERFDFYLTAMRAHRGHRGLQRLMSSRSSTPWSGWHTVESRLRHDRNRYILVTILDRLGRTISHSACDGASWAHTPDCKKRSEATLAEEEERPARASAGATAPAQAVGPGAPKA